MAATTKRLTKHQMKEDAFVTGVFAAREWLTRHSREVTVGVVVVIAAVAALWFFTSRAGGRAQEAAALFGRAAIEMRTGNNALAAIDLRKLIDEHAGSDHAGRGCYMLGQAHFRQRSFVEAEAAFQQYLDDYGADPTLLAASHAGVASCREQSDDWTGAHESYMRAAQVDPSGFLASDVLTSALRTATKIPDADKARAAYDLLQEHFGSEQSIINPAIEMMLEHRFLTPDDVD